MTDMVLVRPRHGLILAGIPRKGAEIPRQLADEWIADQLVERIEPPVQPITRPARKPRRATNARKRRSTR